MREIHRVQMDDMVQGTYTIWTRVTYKDVGEFLFRRRETLFEELEVAENNLKDLTSHSNYWNSECNRKSFLGQSKGRHSSELMEISS